MQTRMLLGARQVKTNILKRLGPQSQEVVESVSKSTQKKYCWSQGKHRFGFHLPATFSDLLLLPFQPGGPLHLPRLTVSQSRDTLNVGGAIANITDVTWRWGGPRTVLSHRNIMWATFKRGKQIRWNFHNILHGTQIIQNIIATCNRYFKNY